MADMPQILFKLSVIFYMAGNLFDMGLRLEWSEALRGLRDVRFVALTLLWGFVLCPALAWSLSRIIPMEPSYGTGVVLMAMAPCAPYMPIIVEKARGDMGYAATMMLLTAVGTVLFMPVAVPLVFKGLTAGALTIAKPLLLFILAPFAAGTVLHNASKPLAEWLHPFVKTTTSIATLVLVLVIFAKYGRDFIGVLGSYTLLTQMLFLAITGTVASLLGFSLKRNRRSVLILGLLSRNTGPAIAPLLAATQVDDRALIAVLLSLPTTVVLSFAVAIWFGRGAQSADSGRPGRDPAIL